MVRALMHVALFVQSLSYDAADYLIKNSDINKIHIAMWKTDASYSNSITIQSIGRVKLYMNIHEEY